jgi:zinc-binding in reverse transcriptase
MWKIIWGLRKVLPKVKMFLWRACQWGLATAAEMHRMIHKISATYARCQHENEYVMHLLFFCPSSRAIWFASDLALQVDGLILNLTELIT